VKGRVDRADRALVEIEVRPASATHLAKIPAWVDTAFTGELVIPREVIDRLCLLQSSAVTAGLADGKEVVLETFSCILNWFGEERSIEAIESNGQCALLGTGLLHDRKLEIDYRLRTLLIV
jgi:clan AA aspartic protease